MNSFNWKTFFNVCVHTHMCTCVGVCSCVCVLVHVSPEVNAECLLPPFEPESLIEPRAHVGTPSVSLKCKFSGMCVTAPGCYWAAVNWTWVPVFVCAALYPLSCLPNTCVFLESLVSMAWVRMCLGIDSSTLFGVCRDSWLREVMVFFRFGESLALISSGVFPAVFFFHFY